MKTKNFLLLLNILHIHHSEQLKGSFTIGEEFLSNPCQSINNCEIQCFVGEYSTDSYIESIQSIYDENGECHSNGVKLVIPSSYFPNKTLKSKWLPVNIKINDLDVDFNKIGVFEQNAFAGSRFANVERFVVRNLWPEEILPKWTFNGLALLKDLSFVNAQLAVGWWVTILISYGLLEFAKNTLNSMTLIERNDSHNKSFLIQHMLGYRSETLVNLEYVDIKYNLTTLNALSFAAITFVRVLDLSDCYISVIEADTFDGLKQNLLILNLERNRLVMLSEGLFLKLSLNPKIQNETLNTESQTTLSIHLEDNPWHCGCKLLFFQELLNLYSNFPGEFLCRTPSEIVDYPIKDSVFCPYPVTTTSTTSTTPIETSTINADNECDERECFDGNKICIQPQMQQINASVKDGIVSVTFKNVNESLAFLWFGSDQLSTDSSMNLHNADIDCIVSLSEEIFITNSNQGTVYTFCSTKVTHSTVSPFDCISIYVEDEVTESKRNWLSEGTKPKVFGVVMSGFVLGILLSVATTVVLLKYIGLYDDNIAVSKDIESTSESIPEVAFNQFMNPSRHIDAIDIPPPLPPHPSQTGPDGAIYYEIVN